jgi:hypothetical protein
MKIRKVAFNNRRKVFTVGTAKGEFEFPYSKSVPTPKRGNYVRDAYVDNELGKEAFTYVLDSGEEGSVPMDAILEYNKDPDLLNELLTYNLSLALKKAVENRSISKREIIKRLGTSPAQFYRIIESRSSGKSLGQISRLLYLLDYDLELVIKDKQPGPGSRKRGESRILVSAEHGRAVHSA